MDGRSRFRVGRLPIGAILLTVGLAAIGAGWGCRGGQTSSPEEFDAEKYGSLPGLSAVPLPALRDELARIVEEGATPELLDSEESPDEENAAAVLRELFDPKKIASILEEADGIYPPAKRGFSFDPIRLQRAVAFRKSYDAQRLRARNALRRPQCDFGLEHRAGQFADLSFVDVVRLLERLEAFQAAEQLADEKLDDAIQTLGVMLHLAECLARQKHVVTRGQAAFLRSEALLLLNAIVHHPKLARKQVEKLYGLIDSQLARWPDDAETWIGDRALGMHCYEVVRDGRILMLLGPEDIERLGGDEVLGQVTEAARRTVNQDELYYLKTMRRVIESCQEPYYKRVGLFEDIRNDLQIKRGTAEFPLVAGNLLLPNVDEGHAIQARDRALCEGWALALAAATGRKRPPFEKSPWTGALYQVVQENGRVEVSGMGTDEAGKPWRLVAPDLSGRK